MDLCQADSIDQVRLLAYKTSSFHFDLEKDTEILVQHRHLPCVVGRDFVGAFSHVGPKVASRKAGIFHASQLALLALITLDRYVSLSIGGKISARLVFAT